MTNIKSYPSQSSGGPVGRCDVVTSGADVVVVRVTIVKGGVAKRVVVEVPEDISCGIVVDPDWVVVSEFSDWVVSVGSSVVTPISVVVRVTSVIGGVEI